MGARRLALVCSVVVFVLLVCLAASTVALAAPEAPVTEPAGSVGANSAVLNGELNPGGLAKAGWYFAYNINGACLGGGTAGGEGVAEVEKKKVSAETAGLEPGTLYTYCLVAYNEVGEETPGSTRSFMTSVSQPEIDSESASSVGSSSARLEAQVNPEKQETSCLRFEYGETAAYGHTTSCNPSSLGEGFGDQTASASLTGLKISTTYHFRVVVENKSSPAGGTYGADQTLTTLPLVGAVSFTNVGANTATLNAQLNVYDAPMNYLFEYGSSSGYGELTTETSSGGGEAGVTVTARLTDLKPDSEYHFRVATQGQTGAERSNDQVFHTLPPEIQGLPDGRVYEMVTPASNEDAEVFAPQGVKDVVDSEITEEGFETKRAFQVAASGDKVAYIAAPTEGGNGEFENNKGDDYLATRDPSGQWTNINIQPPGAKATFYQSFSSDLSTGFLDTRGFNNEPEPMRLSPEAPGEGYNVLYRREFAEESYHPLFTKNPAPISPAEFGSHEVAGLVGAGMVAYAGSSADLGQVLFEANGALNGEAGTPIATENNLYDATPERLALVNVLPSGAAEANATFGAPPLTERSVNPPDFSNVISEDGDRIFWTDLSTDELFAGEGVGTAAARTVQVDVSHGPGVSGGGRFWTASKDGEKVFFTDCNRLTPDSTAIRSGVCASTEPGFELTGNDLYEYDFTDGRLTDLTVDSDPADSLGADVQGVIGASNDGTYVYFVAEGNLAAGAISGEPNLYLRHDGATSFIATLSKEDGNEVFPLNEGVCSECKHVGDWQPGLGHRTAEVSPDGRGVVFTSNRSLDVYPDGTAYPNNGLDEIYAYDAVASHLYCVSCSRSGETPPSSIAGAAAYLPVGFRATYIPQWMSEDGGRVFFDSAEPLVPQDTNGAQDVYEWERDGTGSCREAAGCIYLLSGGASHYWSWLVGGSTSGDDVFIVTRAQLVPQDGNEDDDLYDVRVNGARPVSGPACTGTGCQGIPASPPTFATPASVTFNGVGNFTSPAPAGSVVRKKRTVLTRAQRLAKALKLCKKQSAKKRAKCDAKAKKRYGSASKNVKSHKGGK
jgi:hypothetical protein